jgi:hypothetical protein
MVGRTVSHHCVVKLFESGAWDRLSGRRHGRQIALEFLLAVHPGPAGPRAVPTGSPREEDVFLEAGPGGPECSQIN